MKKLFALLLILALATALIACGGEEPSEPADSNTDTVVSESQSSDESESESESTSDVETETTETESTESEENPKDIWEDIQDAMETEDAVSDTEWSDRY